MGVWVWSGLVGCLPRSWCLAAAALPSSHPHATNCTCQLLISTLTVVTTHPPAPGCCLQLADIPLSADHFRYFAGWADKIQGKTIPCDSAFGKVGGRLGGRAGGWVNGRVGGWWDPAVGSVVKVVVWTGGPGLQSHS